MKGKIKVSFALYLFIYVSHFFFQSILTDNTSFMLRYQSFRRLMNQIFVLKWPEFQIDYLKWNQIIPNKNKIYRPPAMIVIFCGDTDRSTRYTFIVSRGFWLWIETKSYPLKIIYGFYQMLRFIHVMYFDMDFGFWET